MSSVVNPLYILDSKILIPPKAIDKNKIIQPNGIDLYVEQIERLGSKGCFSCGDNVKTDHCYTAVGSAYELVENKYVLKAGEVYKVETAYEINIPNNMMAIIFIRSSLNRNGVQLGSGLWDSGFKGNVGFTLYPHVNTNLYLPCRVAQIVFFEASGAYLYNGQYQQSN